jgi:AraC-like DNA-binding protein
MVSLRCKILVKAEMDKLEIPYDAVDLGQIGIRGSLTKAKLEALRIVLLKSGLEIMDTEKAKLIEKIKTLIIEMVHSANEPMCINFSHYIEQQLPYSYTYLSNVFSEVTGFTISHYIIAQKIELAKELLLYKELNLTEIAAKMNYSSVAHLSAQFKKVTGLTPSHFRKLRQFKMRIALEDL